MTYQKELQALLVEYRKSSIIPSNTIIGDNNPSSETLLKIVGNLLPPDCYLSKSWLIAYQIMHKNLSLNQLKFINKALSFWNNNEELYNRTKENPFLNFDIIRKNGLANCGDLTNAFINEIKNNHVLKKTIENIGKIQFFRTTIYWDMTLENNPLKKKKMQHVFLLYSEGPDKKLKDIIQDILKPSPKTKALDIWKRRAGNAREMIIQHIIDEAVTSQAYLTLSSIDSNETCCFNLIYNKKNQKWSIIPQLNLLKKTKVPGHE